MIRSTGRPRPALIGIALWLLVAASAACASCPCVIRGSIEPPRAGLGVELFDLGGTLRSEVVAATDRDGVYAIAVSGVAFDDLFFASFLLRVVDGAGRVLREEIVYTEDLIRSASRGDAELAFWPIPLD